MDDLRAFVQKLNDIGATKLAVGGSRIFNDEERVKDDLEYIVQNTSIRTIISGGARGVDTFAEEFADDRGLNKTIHPAEWDKYGRSAGFRRNAFIAQEGDAFIGFIKGESRGTRHTFDCVKKLGKPFVTIEVNSTWSTP